MVISKKEFELELIYYLKLQLRRNETLATLNEIPSTSTQQQTLGASTTTSTFRRIVHSVSLLLH